MRFCDYRIYLFSTFSSSLTGLILLLSPTFVLNTLHSHPQRNVSSKGNDAEMIEQLTDLFYGAWHVHCTIALYLQFWARIYKCRSW
ncbi:hypothetical protein EV702DRAFT_753928 [Suillus placidus]|uniref:Uncharacterized protein n=1 Tax=Suillus placidus TaxID=48579 RepID=A0A9P6ZI88_9AGAM|nr:hypothetical protein EV702DRAFT_753928 [Suillus placidus]